MMYEKSIVIIRWRSCCYFYTFSLSTFGARVAEVRKTKTNCGWLKPQTNKNKKMLSKRFVEFKILEKVSKETRTIRRSVSRLLLWKKPWTAFGFSPHLKFLFRISAVCTPFGFVKLFGVVGQVLVKPHLLRDVDEEFQTFNLEEAFLRRKLENSYNCVTGKRLKPNSKPYWRR